MPKPLKEFITTCLDGIQTFGNKPFNAKQLASKLFIGNKNDMQTLQLVLDQLKHEGDIEEISVGRYLQKYIPQIKEGILDLNQKGNGYVICDDETPDVFVSRDMLNTALDRDKVKVQLERGLQNGKPFGRVAEILSRKKTDWVGIIHITGNYATLDPDDKKMYTPIHIPLKDSMNAREGDKVLVRMTGWENPKLSPTGKVMELLGRPGNNDTEMHAIVAEFGFATKFPKEVEDEADKIPTTISNEEVAKRRDFRGITTFTIDPADAKDFDDAISYEDIGKDRYRVGVHIADVSHYVTPGSILDKEAYKRATSVYLVDRTIPMLPEKLSNGLCSLRPDEDKLCFSAVFEMDIHGKVYNTWIGRTVIRSIKRFSYEDAQEVLENKEGPYATELLTLNKIAHALREQKFNNGAISFETAEVKFKLDENGKPLSVYIKERKDAHKLIEDFMLLANRSVAEFAGKGKDGKPNKQTFVYRVHDKPNMDKLAAFEKLARKFGHRIEVKNIAKLSHNLNALLHNIEGKPEQNLLQGMAIRTMAKALYTTKETSHYGLAFDYYNHFTSPIRRYPAVMVHKLVEHYLASGKPADSLKYEEYCKHSSQQEIQATEAERASTKYKQVELMQSNVGREFDGIISGVTEWGVFVEVVENKCEGMIRSNTMSGGPFAFDESSMTLKNRKYKFTFGDPIKIRVAKANLEKRQLDFEVV